MANGQDTLNTAVAASTVTTAAVVSTTASSAEAPPPAATATSEPTTAKFLATGKTSKPVTIESLWSTVGTDPPDRILPFLYLDNEIKALNPAALRPLKITHILNATLECKNWLMGYKSSV